MKIRITNLAKVSDIEIALDGLTIIAGKNATGKSSVSRAVMTYFTLVRRLEDHIREARIDGIGKGIAEILFTGGRGNWRTRDGRWLRFLSEDDDIMSSEFWSDSEKVGALISRILRHDSVRNSLITNRNARDLFDENGDLIEKIRKVKEVALNILSTSDSEYEEFSFRTTFNNVFCGQINSLFSLDSPATITITTNDAQCKLSIPYKGLFVLPKSHILGFRMVSYLEPMHILDAIAAAENYEEADDMLNRYDSGLETWQRMLHTKRYDPRLSFEDDRDIRKAQDVLNRIGNILQGKLIETDESIKFAEDDIPEPIDLKNLASGAKSIAMVVKAIENGAIREGDLFIIDEPESNLHPEWQVRFAELLTLLLKELSIKVLINTHSPYFLKAIEMFSKKYNVSERTHYYFMENVSSCGSVGREITSDLTVAYESLYTPLAKLMEI